jgi:hypothetical protein
MYKDRQDDDLLSTERGSDGEQVDLIKSSLNEENRPRIGMTTKQLIDRRGTEKKTGNIAINDCVQIVIVINNKCRCLIRF